MKLLIESDLRDALVAYLIERPYKEVAMAVENLTRLQPPPAPPAPPPPEPPKE